MPRGVQPALYGGLIVLQGLDVHSTLRAIDAGYYEQNPLMRWTVSHPAAFISMKAAASAATIYVAEKIRKRHPKHAMLFMAAVNSATRSSSCTTTACRFTDALGLIGGNDQLPRTNFQTLPTPSFQFGRWGWELACGSALEIGSWSLVVHWAR